MFLTSTRILTRSALSSSNLAASCSFCQSRSAHKLVEIELLQDIPKLGLIGARIPIAPGRARNDLIPRGKALLVVGGKVVSSSRDMLRRESMLKRYVPAAAALPVAQDLSDPTIAARAAEIIILDALSPLPTLQFHRLLKNPTIATLPGQLKSITNNEIFGSVSVNDVIGKIAEYGVLLDETSGAIEHSEGVDKGRIKSVGKYTYTVEFKALQQSVSVQIEVLPEV